MQRSNNRYVDAEGEEDLGNIDVLAFDGDTLLVEGDWGEVRIYSAEKPRFEIGQSTP